MATLYPSIAGLVRNFYDPASGRVTPLVIAGPSPRAFHQVVVLGTDPNGDVRLAVSGGLGVAGDAAAPGNVAAIGGPAGEAPWAPVAADAAMGRAGAVPIAAELLTYSPSTRAVMRTPIVGASGAPAAAGGQPDADVRQPAADRRRPPAAAHIDLKKRTPVARPAANPFPGSNEKESGLGIVNATEAPRPRVPR